MPCVTPSPPIQCWKRCWVCVQMVNFFRSTSKNKSNIFGHFWKHLFFCEIKPKPTLIRGKGVVKYAILHIRNDFCRDHCVLATIKHKTVSHIYGTPLVHRPDKYGNSGVFCYNWPCSNSAQRIARCWANSVLRLRFSVCAGSTESCRSAPERDLETSQWKMER